MQFIWAKKIARLQQTQIVSSAEVSAVVQVQEVQLPVYTSDSDKISGIEHKNGECLASSRKEDDAFGGGKEEVDGQEVVLPCAEDGEGVLQEGTLDGEEDSSPLASLKK